MEKAMTIQEVARQFNRDRSTVLKWITRGLFPNAEFIESPVINYWVIPAADVESFKEPRPRKEK